MPKKIMDEQLLTLPEVKEILTERGENSELGYIQRVTLDYTMKFAATDREKARKLVNELVSKFDFMDENMAVQIVNAMPMSIPELRVFVTEKHKVVLSSDLEKMLGIVDKFR
ncbi:MAG: RNA polymerase Rpb4 family protein [Promethearchaeota archaeon]